VDCLTLVALTTSVCVRIRHCLARERDAVLPDCLDTFAWQGLFWSANETGLGCRAHGRTQPAAMWTWPLACIRKWPHALQLGIALYCRPCDGAEGAATHERATINGPWWSAPVAPLNPGNIYRSRTTPKRSDKPGWPSLGQAETLACSWQPPLPGDGSTRDQRPPGSTVVLLLTWGDAGECLCPFRKRSTGEMLRNFSSGWCGLSVCSPHLGARSSHGPALGLALCPISGLA